MLMRTGFAVGLLAMCASSGAAQMAQDGALLPRGTVMSGAFYSRDSWNEYWEGALKRSNDNIGTLTAQSVTVLAGYGVTSRLTALATMPYVHTHASQGVLHDMRGIQDLTVAAKYRLFSTQESTWGSATAFVVGSAALPMSNYSPDFMPLSIGTGGRRVAARVTMDFTAPSHWFATGSAAYTLCANVKLDRSAYYTNGQLYLTNEVAMPNAMDYTLSTGFARGAWRVPLTIARQLTLGGGDIRRQDMPFVSNRVDFTRAGVDIHYMPGVLRGAELHAGVARVLAGRNVGQSTTLTSGLTYSFRMP
jgi:Putative MetA-pathway of phenol degradation